jgi:probable LLM family oxidoreductase
MELGISMFGDVGTLANGTTQPAHLRLQELVEEIKLMDQVGLDYFGIGEHHRADYAVTTPEIILAAAAAVTKNIRLGSAVSVLSSSDPVRLYQNFAMVDGISNGRAELMAGRGSFTESFPLFGYDLHDYDALFIEKLELLLQLNQPHQKINWKGKFRAALHNQEIFPKPVNGQLDIWIAVGGTPESVHRAAALGIPVMFAIIGGNPAHFKPLFDYYREVYEASGHDMQQLRTGVHVHAFFGEDSAATARDYYPVYAAQMNRIGRQRGWPPYQPAQFEAGRAPKGHLAVGNAAETVDKILYLHETLGLTRFAAHLDVGGPSHASIMKAIEIYGTQIAPQVRAALKP